ncbi:MAG: 3-hydroxybutyryl-CoA dehydrogenase, partial [Caulobacteraceae bacterium]
MTTITTVAILGAGQMGAGIAQAVALGGYSVRLYDVVADRLPLAQGEIAASLSRHVARGLIDQAAADAALARIAVSDVMADAVAGADLVIEAALEDEAVKKAIYAQVLPHLGPQTLLASNTSSISITRLASSTDRPDRFV